MTGGTEFQEAAEAPTEGLDTSAESEALNDATFEPEAKIVFEGNLKEAEALESTFVDSVQLVPAAEAAPAGRETPPLTETAGSEASDDSSAAADEAGLAAQNQAAEQEIIQDEAEEGKEEVQATQEAVQDFIDDLADMAAIQQDALEETQKASIAPTPPPPEYPPDIDPSAISIERPPQVPGDTESDISAAEVSEPVEGSQTETQSFVISEQAVIDFTGVQGEAQDKSWTFGSEGTEFAEALKELEKGAEDDGETSEQVIRQTAAEPLGEKRADNGVPEVTSETGMGNSVRTTPLRVNLNTSQVKETEQADFATRAKEEMESETKTKDTEEGREFTAQPYIAGPGSITVGGVEAIDIGVPESGEPTPLDDTPTETGESIPIDETGTETDEDVQEISDANVEIQETLDELMNKQAELERMIQHQRALIQQLQYKMAFGPGDPMHGIVPENYPVIIVIYEKQADGTYQSVTVGTQLSYVPEEIQNYINMVNTNMINLAIDLSGINQQIENLNSENQE